MNVGSGVGLENEGSAWLIVHTQPSLVRDGEAVWGPSSDALEPVTYRFRVTHLARAEYDYVLEGRPKTSRSDDDYLTVRRGHGYGKGHVQRGEGELSLDLSVARTLDPFTHQDDSGTVRIAHHLPAAGALPLLQLQQESTLRAATTPIRSISSRARASRARVFTTRPEQTQC